MKKILLFLLLACSISTFAQADFPEGIQLPNNVSSSTATKVSVQEADGVINWKYFSDFQKEKALLSTGLLKNGLIVTNADPTKFNITAGIGVISNFNDPENPISTIINFPAFTGVTPTYLLTGTITYVAINSTPMVVMQATPFTPEQRRSLITLGAVIHSNLTTINVLNNISAPTNAGTNQLHDFIEAVGALNLTGNKYVANGANLQLNKSAGLIFKLGSNFAVDWKNPHELAQTAGTALTFRYRTQNGTEGSDRVNLDPALYDLNNVLTAVPNNKFTIQTVVMFQTGLTRILYGQTIYDDLASAKNAIFTRNFVIEPNSKENGIIRAYIIMRNNTTSLQTVADAEILEAQKFGGVASGGVALTLANIVDALGFTPENVANKQNSLAVDGTGTKYPTVDAVNAKLPITYSKIVYVNATSPTTATIFDLNNPPVTNDNSLKLDVNNLYIGTDASTWVYLTSPAGYVTKTISSETSNFYLSGTTTDAGNSKTASISRTGNTTIGANTSSLAKLNVTGNVNSSSLIARGTYLNNTLIATANNDVLVGLDIMPTFTTGAFTGVSSYAMRISGNIIPSVSNLYSFGAPSFNFSQLHARQLLSSGTNGFEFFPSYTVKSAQWFTSGNLLLQNGGTFIDAGYRFDVNGTTRLQSTVTLGTSPTTSAGGFEPITRNTTTGVIEKVASGYYATSASPTFTGNPTVPTQVANPVADYSTKIANTEFVGNILLNYAKSASPTFTGTPTAPTATVGTNTTQIATTAFVQSTTNANAVVLTGNQTITGRKTFNSDNTTAGGITISNTRTINTGGTSDSAAISIINSGNSGIFIESTGSGDGILAKSITNGNAITAQSFGTGTALTLRNNGGTGDLLYAELGATRVTSAGAFISNDITANGILKLKNYTVATLPTGVQGATAYVTDATAPTYLRTLTGGGSVKCPVFYDGTVWRSTIDSDSVSLTGNQTIGGIKTFSSGLSGQLTGSVVGYSTQALTGTSSVNTDYPIVFSESYSGTPTILHGGNITINPVTSELKANSFIKSGGTSSQFLKADGSIDNGDVVKNIAKEASQGSNVTGTVSETILYSKLIPANTLKNGDIINLFSRIGRPSTTSSSLGVNHRIRINTSNTLTGATQIALNTMTAGVSGNQVGTLSRVFSLDNGFIKGTISTQGYPSDLINLNSSIESNTFNPAVDNYIFITGQLGFSADTMYHLGTKITN